MNSPFTPLASGPAALPNPLAAAQPSAPATGVRKSASAADSKIAKTFRPISARTDPAAAPSAPEAEPKVTLEKDGDQVTQIKVQCGCGHIIELNCVY